MEKTNADFHVVLQPLVALSQLVSVAFRVPNGQKEDAVFRFSEQTSHDLNYLTIYYYQLFKMLLINLSRSHVHLLIQALFFSC